MKRDMKPSVAEIFYLVLCCLLFLRQTGASLLSSPELQWSQSLDNLGDDLIGEGNGVAIDESTSRAFITTFQGKLLQAAFDGGAARILFQPPQISGFTTRCSGGVVLFQQYAIFAVTYQGNNPVTRIFLVPTDLDTVNDPGQTSVRIVVVAGTVKGTPLLNEDGHLIVVHDISTSAGKLSIFDLTDFDPSTGYNQVGVLPNGNDAANVRVLSPPTMTRVTLDSGTEADWIIIGENENNGESNNGNLYAIRYDPSTKEALWLTLAQGIGSMKAAPGVSPDGITIAVAVNKNFIRGWVESTSIRSILHANNPSKIYDVLADFQLRISKVNSPIAVQPVVMGNKVLIQDLSSDLIAFNMNTRNELWRISTFSSHTTPPILREDKESGKLIAYDISTIGILRQVEIVSPRFQEAVELYRANCRGFLNPSTVNVFSETQQNCGPSTLASHAVSADGNFVVFAGSGGRITALRVADYGTRTPAIVPSPPPTAAPTRKPTGAPTRAPTRAPTTQQPTIKPTQKPLPLNPPPTWSPTLAPRNPTPTKAPQATGGSGPTTAAPVKGPEPTTAAPVRSPQTTTAAPVRSPQTTTAAPVRGSSPSPTASTISNSGEEEEEEGTIGTNTAGIGSDPDSGSGGGMGSLAIGLGMAAAVLFCAIMGALYFMRRRSKDCKEEHDRIQRESAVERAWISNKKIYEEEMRREEEETLNALAPPVATQAAQVLASKNKQQSRRLKGRKRSAVVGATGTLGSISESECEEGEYRVESDFGDGDDQESGFEIALEHMEKGSQHSDDDSEVETSSIGTPSPGNTPPTSPSKVIPKEDLKSIEEFEPPTFHREDAQEEPSLPPVALAPTPVGASNHSRWFQEVMAVRASSLEKTKELSSPPRDSTILKSDGEPLSPPIMPSSPQEPLPEDEPGLIPSGRAYPDQTPPPSPTAENMPRSPSDLLSIADVVSVDSSLYLEGSTVATPMSAPEGGSVVSARSARPFSPEGGSVLSARSAIAKPTLAPPDGGSVLSISSVPEEKDPEADEFFDKPYTPGAHYLTQKRVSASGGGVSVASVRSKSPPVAVPGGSIAVASIRSRSPAAISPPNRVESPSPASMSSRALQRTFEEAGSTRGATMYGEALPPQQSRAGLFSRRGRAIDRLLPQYESDATASASETEGDSNQRRPKEVGNKSRPIPPPDPSPPRDAPSGGSVGAVSIGSDQTKKLKNPPRDAPRVGGASVGAVSTGSAKFKKPKSMWTSFISEISKELSKAEEQFFNPVTSSSSSSRPGAPGAKLPSRTSAAGVPPAPPSRLNRDSSDYTDESGEYASNRESNNESTDYDSDGSEEPPPPPPPPYRRQMV